MGRATAGLADQPDALRGACTFANLTLPEPLPAEPMGLVMEWINLAGTSKTQPNPNAMTLATVDGQGRPSARIVLCRKIDAARGVFVFYTNYDSRKGLEAEGAGGGQSGNGQTGKAPNPQAPPPFPNGGGGESSSRRGRLFDPKGAPPPHPRPSPL